ncbi:MAG: hypothetical protein HYY06_11185 [Deltaproteobacteria bacterium]|nr:hypothetical protein [Deltaproteobacteria bacterium]
MSESGSKLRAWILTAAAVLAYLAGYLVPVPGLDQAVLSQVSRSGEPTILGLFNQPLPMLSVFNNGLAWLILVRGLLLLSSTPAAGPARLRRLAIAGFAAYTILSFGSGLFLAFALEQLGGHLGEIVAFPGWAFRLETALTLAAGSAVVWALASVITRQGLARGPLLLYGAASVVSAASALGMLGPVLATRGWDGVLVASQLAGCVPPVLVLFALWRWSIPWPLPVVRQASLLSGADALVLPAIAGAIVGAPLQMGLSFLPTLPSAGLRASLGPVIAIAAAVAVALHLRRRSIGRGQAVWLAGAVVLPALAFVIFAGGVVASGSLARLLEPGPFAGEGAFAVGLESEGGDGVRDGRRIVRRLAALDVDAEVVRAGRGHIDLRIDGVRDVRAALEAVLPQRRLGFHLVATDQGALVPAPGEEVPALRIEDDGDGPHWVGPTPESLDPIRARVQPSPGRAALVECQEQPDAEPRCRPWLVETPALLTGRDVAEAKVAFDEMDMRLIIPIVLTAEGGRRFGDVTAASVGRWLAMVLDDRVLVVPKIMQAIRGGRAQITLGAGRPEDQLREAKAIAAALASGPLGSRWQIASLDAAR